MFEIGPAYRAEKHDTPRHINEFVSLDVEMAFIESEQDLMDLEAGILAAIFTGIRETNQRELDAWKATVPDPDLCARIPRVSHDEAKEIVSKETGKKVYEITPEGERALCEWAMKTAGIEAAFVYAYPRKSRPFYTFPAENNKTRSFDLLFRGLEVTSGSMRINRYDMLVENLQTFDLKPEGLERLPLDLQVRLPAARWVRDRHGAAHAEDPRPRQREGSHAVPEGPEADEAVGTDAEPGESREDGRRS